MIDNLKKCKLIVFDFDGVMTDNRVLVLEDGREAVFCNRADGLGIKMLREAGFQMLILSTETNVVVKTRAKKLNLPVIHGSDCKESALNEYCNKNNIPVSETCFVGNDINDIKVMKLVGFSVCPSDAHKDVKKISDVVLNVAGGSGITREIAELLDREETGR